MGHEVSVVLPRYRGTRANTVVMPSMTIPLGDRLRFPAVADGTVISGVRYFFVDDPEYFDREALYGEQGKDYPDNAERFAEFSRAAIEIAKHIWPPDVIHCHDWQTALVPVLLRTLYAEDPLVKAIPVVFTIHNMGYHGQFPRTVLSEIGLPENLFRMDAMEFFGKVNFLKAGLVFSDFLTTVSPSYSKEIQTAEYGHGLDGVVRDRAADLRGILNGADYSIWSPQIDSLIAAQYSPKDLSGKKTCKKDLLQQFKLDATDLQRPLIGIVSRFAAQKGFDLIEEIADQIVSDGAAIVALGAGEPRYETLFRDLAAKYPRQVGVKVAYDNTLAHKIEAGADVFLMPSRYEPCGLNQMYSLRYGTVPIVRATGGLDDTIEQYDAATGKGTGFKFTEYDAPALLKSVREALAVYRNPQAWLKLQLAGMARDYSWRASAKEYAEVYEGARKARILQLAPSSNSVIKREVAPAADSKGKGTHG
jgi:starch synthase